MVDEVVAGEGVDEVDVSRGMGDRDGDHLAVACRRRVRGGKLEQIGRIGREQRGRDQGGHVVAVSCSQDDLGDGPGVANGELMDQVLGFGGHGCSIGVGPDTGLTRGIGRTLRW